MRAEKREWWNLSGSQIAETCGITRAALSLWVGEGAPKRDRDSYDIRLVVAWLRARDRQKFSGALGAAQTRWTEAKARVAEMKADQIAGTLVPVALVMDMYSRLVGAAKNKFLGMGSKLAVLGMACEGPAELKQLIDDEAWQILDELSRTPIDDGPGRRRTPKKISRKPKKQSSHKTRKVHGTKAESTEARQADSPEGRITQGPGV